jgi:hypothetical protein
MQTLTRKVISSLAQQTQEQDEDANDPSEQGTNHEE